MSHRSNLTIPPWHEVGRQSRHHLPERWRPMCRSSLPRQRLSGSVCGGERPRRARGRRTRTPRRATSPLPVTSPAAAASTDPATTAGPRAQQATATAPAPIPVTHPNPRLDLIRRAPPRAARYWVLPAAPARCGRSGTRGPQARPGRRMGRVRQPASSENPGTPGEPRPRVFRPPRG